LVTDDHISAEALQTITDQGVKVLLAPYVA